MAEIFPDEGLDAILAIVPKNGTNLANTYMFLFTGGTASTVPASSATIGTMGGGFAEATGTSYARQAIAAASWGSAAAGTGGRKVTAGQVTFPTVGSGGWGTINGFGLASASTSGVALFYANFDDTTAITSAVNDVIKVTPTWQINS